jgi:hypothetical protein
MNGAIYIDADNVSYKCIDDIITKSSDYNIISKKIYADWTHESMKKWAEKARKYGFEGIQCFGNKFKQTSDVYMITDVINDLYTNNHLQVIILATSDIDFTRLCHIIKSKNKKLVIFTPQKSSLENMSENSKIISDKFTNSENITMPKKSKKRKKRNNLLELLKKPFDNCNVLNISKYKKKLKSLMIYENISYKFDFNHIDTELRKYPKYFGIIKRKNTFKIIGIFHLHQYKINDIKQEWIDSSYQEILNYYKPQQIINIIYNANE